MNKIHIGQSYIIALNNGAPRGRLVVTLKGVREAIARGAGPGVIDTWTLTPAAAIYWADYKTRINHAGN
jgi:hypothetical protein